MALCSLRMQPRQLGYDPKTVLFVEILGWIGFVGCGLWTVFSVFALTITAHAAPDKAATNTDIALIVIPSAWFVAGSIILSIKYFS